MVSAMRCFFISTSTTPTLTISPHLERFAGVFDEAVGDTADVHKSVLMYANVDERAEINHVAHRAHQFHAGLQVFDIQHVGAKDGLGQVVARVSARLLQLTQDVTQASVRLCPARQRGP